jgi:Lon protease-like protein
MSYDSSFFSFESIISDLPTQVPAMILPGCVLLPGAILPLYIFEERYREMLADALQGNRMFCVATALEGAEESEDGSLEAGAYRFSTLGMIRTCVGNEDGTAHLVLQGLVTIRLIDWVDSGEKSYPEVKIVEAEPEVHDSLRAQELAKEVMGYLDDVVPSSAISEDQWEQLLHRMRKDSAALATFTAGMVVHSVEAQQEFLSAATVEERLELVVGGFAAGTSE